MYAFVDACLIIFVNLRISFVRGGNRSERGLTMKGFSCVRSGTWGASAVIFENKNED